MVWPDTSLTTQYCDQVSDSPQLARAEILATIQATELIRLSRGVAGGIASLDSAGYMPSSQLLGSSIITALHAWDGANSGLDADMLDGLEATALVRVDGTQSILMDGILAASWGVASTTTSAAIVAPLTVGIRKPGGGAPGAGFGSGVALQADNAARALTTSGRVDAVWSAATASNETSFLSLKSMKAGSLTEHMRVYDNLVHLVATVGSDPGAPSAGGFIYFRDGALYYHAAGGGEVGPLTSSTGAGTSHHALTNLLVDDHTMYALADGTRGFTGEIQTGANAVLCTHLGADPSAPASGTSRLYFKSGGLYYRTPSGVVGPLTATSATDHATLSNRSAADAHSQYALLQPAAALAFNASNADHDFTYRGTTVNNLFNLDAAENALFLAESGTTALGRLHAKGSATLPGIYCTTASGSAPALKAVAVGTGAGLFAVADTDSAGYFVRNVASPSSGIPVVDILEDHASSTEAALRVRNDGSGANVARFYSGGSAAANEILRIGADTVYISPDGTGGFGFAVVGNSIGSLFVVDGANDLVQVDSSASVGTVNIERDGNTALYVASTAGFAAVIGSMSATATDGALKATSTAGIAIRGESTTGIVASFYRNTSASAGNVVEIHQDHSSSADAALYVQQDGTGSIVEFATWNEVVMSVHADGTTYIQPDLKATASTARGLYVLSAVLPASTSSATFIGVEQKLLVTSTVAITGTVAAGKSCADHFGTDTVATLIGHDFLAAKTNTGGVTALAAGRFQIQNNHASATVADGAAISILAKSGAGSWTAAWAIKSASTDPSYFLGGITLGSAAAPDGSAALDIVSTTKGLLLPRMTSTQRDAISSPANGLVLFNTTTSKIQGRAAGSWVDLH